MAMLLGWTLLCTMSAIVFGFVFGIVVQSIVYGSPAISFAVLMLGPMAGAIGGPVFGAVYGAALQWRGRAAGRGRAALLAGVLGGLIFAAVGGGFQMWEASHRSSQPTRATITATPDGGRVMHRSEGAPGTAGLVKTVFATGSVTALGGFLYGSFFGAMFGTKPRREVV
jgi:hypothetical protein